MIDPWVRLITWKLAQPRPTFPTVVEYGVADNCLGTRMARTRRERSRLPFIENLPKFIGECDVESAPCGLPERFHQGLLFHWRGGKNRLKAKAQQLFPGDSRGSAGLRGHRIRKECVSLAGRKLYSRWPETLSVMSPGACNMTKVRYLQFLGRASGPCRTRMR